MHITSKAPTICSDGAIDASESRELYGRVHPKFAERTLWMRLMELGESGAQVQRLARL